MERHINMDPKELLKNIECLRSELIVRSTQFGFAHEKTLKLSHELDRYILQYQRLMAAAPAIR
ncbi:hypothetical protein A8F94_08955 [Bacillus sp. FJAT-27225]|uniref:aspartyl-phosphate phosphatase Spo0E family protein n=1 Tax=Bacillus sp. FJAT-27225 TaxID=1743144 RepID=UPI00080C2CF2|nr:aspartyl-phosphate phosphatase Spo0E family protein [Bacillus sp. FJAT-27225]OCA87946.1 hypothetical protein A8F94_08955 [Bacillus sp. FJAT-27225]